MSTPQPPPLLRYLRRLAGAAAPGDLTDAVLLQRFVASRDEAAFELLLWRHGLMVLGVCRGVLRQEADVEDAFQATFFTLARKAGSIRRQSLAGWLYRVAHRVALKARERTARRAAPAPDVDVVAARNAREPAEEAAWREVRPFLHEEVGRLPAKYRIPIVLCYLEGRTNEEAARELGWTKGTVSGRLARARDLLRRRLTRRGLVLPAALLGLAAVPDASMALSAEMIRTSARAALAFAGGALELVPAQPAALAKGVLRTMAMTRLTLALTAVLVLGAAGITAGLFAQADPTPAPALAGDEKPTTPPAPKPRPAPRLVDVASPRDGIIAQVAVTVGESVKPGQLLARLDDRLARAEVAVWQQKVKIAGADYETARKAADQAKIRYEQVVRLAEAKAVTKEEVAERRLAWDKFEGDAKAKKEAIGLEELHVRQAQTVVELHEIRSPVRGVIRHIYKDPGEGIKALDPVMQIERGVKVAAPVAGRAGRQRIDVASPRDGIVTAVMVKAGDAVKAGQVLARLDDRVTRAELDAQQAKVKLVQAEFETAVKTRDEARVRWERLKRLAQTVDFSREEYEERRLAYEKYRNDADAKKEAIKEAELEVEQVRTVLAMHEIRSPGPGVVRIVYRNLGEGVRALDPVVQIERTKE